MADARRLYKKRWAELAKLRLAVLQDQSLTKHDHERVGSALQVDQEGVTAVLSK